MSANVCLFCSIHMKTKPLILYTCSLKVPVLSYRYRTLCLFFAAVPDTVRNLNTTVLSPQAVTISWLPPQGGATYLDYRVTVTPLYSNTQSRLVTTASTSIVITGLQPGTFYLCVVAARTSAGLQQSVNIILVEMPADGNYC